MSSHSPSPERTFNRVVRAGVTVANVARRRRPRRRARRRSPPPSPPKSSQPSTLQPPSLSFPDQELLSHHPPPLHSQPQTRRRNDLRETLLFFPEHDPSTVSTLLNHYHGDRHRVIEILSQARATPSAAKSSPNLTTSPAQKPITQAIPIIRDDRPSQPLPSSPRTPPPLTLASQPGHRKRPSRRFSREAAAPLWAAAVRTATSSDASSVANAAYSPHPGTRRVAGTKRPRRSPTTSDTTDASTRAWQDLPPTPPKAINTSRSAITAVDTTGDTMQNAMVGDQHSEKEFPSSAAGAVGTFLSPGSIEQLIRRVQELEAALSRFTEQNESGRMDVGRRLESAELDMGAIERRHETLEHDLEENRKRVSKTEQYLDTMRRDVRYAIGGRESRFFVIVRQGMNGVLYYLLAYLVPVLFFIARGIRGGVAVVRRRFARNSR